jgi:hypothetical protein
MRMIFPRVLDIRDLGNHAVATLVELGLLLAGTVNARPDPKRPQFYEIEAGQTVYYVYAAAVSGVIFLLAKWERLASPDAQWLLAN